MKRSAALALAVVLAAAACRDQTQPLGPVAPARVAEVQDTTDAVPGQYIVRFRDNVADVPGRAKALANANGGRLRYVFTLTFRGFSAELPPAALQALAHNPEIARIDPNHRGHGATTQSGPDWGLDRIDQRSLPLSSSYTYNETGAGVHAYIVDSGIRMTHADFGGRATSGYDYVDNDADASDCNGHGTHVAATVGGATYGVAKSVSLVAVRVLDCYNQGTEDGILKGIEWVQIHAVKPAVANLSLTMNSPDATVDTAVSNLIASGVTVAVAAGNGTANNSIPANACNISPARVSTALTVGASDASDNEATFSNYGTCVDLLAPGVNITSAWDGSDTDTNTISGTSMATPHVTGAAALYLQSAPTASPSTVATAITGNGTQNVLHLSSTSASAGTPNLLLFERWIGYGMSASITGPSLVGNGATCTWNSSVTGGVAPYSYYWNQSNITNAYLGFFGNTSSSLTATGNYGGSYGAASLYLGVSVTDANGVTIGAPLKQVTVSTSASGCS